MTTKPSPIARPLCWVAANGSDGTDGAIGSDAMTVNCYGILPGGGAGGQRSCGATAVFGGGGDGASCPNFGSFQDGGADGALASPLRTSKWW